MQPTLVTRNSLLDVELAIVYLSLENVWKCTEITAA